ncbi:MAG TPA: sulfite exporter TauE/SafE family protein [Gemmatimonadaceae bacterium]|nr:sulfite exporter TauE/SafE family protein [Gemmatimonadaceae bacterium]
MAITMGSVAAIWLAAVLGSAHCVGMCGPFVAFYRADPARKGSPWVTDAAYHVGRLLSYASLGALGGAAGAGAEQLGRLAGIARGAGWVAGLLMIFWATGTLLSLRGISFGHFGMPSALQRLLRAGIRLSPSHPAGRAAVLGLLSALLPCGWLYVYVAVAAGTASPAGGAVVMTVFWSGTLPAMASAGWLFQRLTGRLRRHIPTATALLVLMFGLFTIAGRLQLRTGHATATAPLHVHGH